MDPVVVLEDALRLRSARPRIDGWAEGTVGLRSGRVGAGELVADGRTLWFALGAGEFVRETSKLFADSTRGAELADTLGISTDAGCGRCWGVDPLSSPTGVSVVFASSISPSSTSSFPEAVLTIFGTPLTLEL